jgi:ornithine cyclodeaminase
VCDPGQHAARRIAPNLNSLLTSSDLILFTTVAARPHVHDPAIFAHNPVVLHVSLRDLAPEVLLQACNIVDDVDHVMNADTSLHLAEKLTGGRDFVSGTLADVISGRKCVNPNQPIIFSPFGLGILDLALGKWVHDKAIIAGENIAVQDFFYDLER